LDTSFAGISERLDNLESVETRLNTSINNRLDNLRQDFSAIARQTVTTEIQGIQNNLRTMQDQINSINTRLPTRINEAVTEAMTGFRQEVQTDLNLVQQNISRLNKKLVQLNTGTPAVGGNVGGLSQPVIARSIVTNDLTEIDGIGPVFAKRLQENNIFSFADLASISSDELASILKTSVAKIDSLQLQQKAAEKLKG
jgi:exonuclease VII large subunit